MSEAEAMDRTARIEEQIWRLENSYGEGSFQDGLVTTKIAELRAQLKPIEGKMNNATTTSPAIRDVLAEREQQVAVHAFTAMHDDQTYSTNELARAAACYAVGTDDLYQREGTDWHKTTEYEVWPWDAEWWKPKNTRHNLVKAAALIIAEIERLDRAASTTKEG